MPPGIYREKFGPEASTVGPPESMAEYRDEEGPD